MLLGKRLRPPTQRIRSTKHKLRNDDDAELSLWRVIKRVVVSDALLMRLLLALLVGVAGRLAAAHVEGPRPGCAISPDGVPACGVGPSASSLESPLGLAGIQKLSDALRRRTKRPRDLQHVVPLAEASWVVFNESCAPGENGNSMRTLGACAELGLQLAACSVVPGRANVPRRSDCDEASP